METLGRGQPKCEESWEGRSRQPYSRIPQITYTERLFVT